jgi:hypothetical protein
VSHDRRGLNYDTRYLQWGIDFLVQTKGASPFRKLVFGRFSLDEINEAMNLVRSGELIPVAAIPQPGEIAVQERMRNGSAREV